MKKILMASALLCLSVSAQAMTVECVVSSKHEGSSIQKMVTDNPNFMADLTSVEEAYYSVITQGQSDGQISVRIVRDADGERISEDSLTGKVVLEDEQFGVKITCSIKK